MDKGRFNSFILVSLFIISLFLASKTLFDPDTDIFPFLGKDRGYSTEDSVISQIILPKRILLNYSPDTHTVVHSNNEYDLWNKSKKIIRDTFMKDNINITEISKQDFVNEKSKKSISIELPDEFPISLISKALGVPVPINIEGSIESIKEIYIRIGSETYIILSNNDKTVKINNSKYNIEDLAKTVEVLKNSRDFINYYPSRLILGTKADLYVPNSMDDNEKKIYVDNDIELEKDENIDKIVEGFFDKDLSYLRKVVDNSGTIVYMYNQNTGLLVYPNGLIEYSKTLDKVTLERDIEESLNTLIEFVNTKDRFPKEGYLAKVEEITSEDDSKGYRFTFDYKIDGRTVYINNSRDSDNAQLIKPLVIEVFNDQVKSYKRLYRDVIVKEDYQSSGNEPLEIEDYKEDEKKDRYNPEEIINKNIKEFIDEENDMTKKNIDQEVIASIDNISLGYYDNGKRYYSTPLVEVWVIDIGEKRYLFEIDSGEKKDVEVLE